MKKWLRFVLISGCLCVVNLSHGLDIVNPRVEYKTNPLDISVANPRFSWALDSDIPATRQLSYRILVKDMRGKIVWDSGIVKSAESYNVYFPGSELNPESRYEWELEVVDNHGEKAHSISFFETAPIDWRNAQWIGGDEKSAPFHSQYQPVFSLAFDIYLGRKSKGASIIYGGNDWRLLDRRKNPSNIKMGKDEAYIEVNFAVDSIRLYRHNYSPSDAGHPYKVSFAVPQNIDMCIPHSVRINSVSGRTSIILDSEEIGSVNLNPIGSGGDYLAFPVVGDVGYAVSDGGDVTINNFRVESFRAPHNILSSLQIGKVSGKKIMTPPETGAIRIRNEFRIDKKVKNARLYATARGVYDFYVNGKPVTDRYLNPGLTQYNRHHSFQIYDITHLLNKGDNVAGIQLNEGWWSGASSFEPANWNWFGNRQSVLCRIKIEYEDGTTANIVSNDTTWKYSNDGSVRYGSLFQGEIYDARRGGLDWTVIGYDDSNWRKVSSIGLQGVVTEQQVGGWPLANDYSDFTFIADNNPGVACHETLISKSIYEPSPGQYVYDMGQNCAGVPEITFRGLKKGQKVAVRFAEVLYPEHDRYKGLKGLPMVENLRAAMAQDVYIASGEPVETFSPRSTYHGYRYIEITGIDAPLPNDEVKSKVLSSVDRFTSGFCSSDSLLNKLVSNIRYSTLSNVFSIPTDCPQRNERMGWSGDVSVFAPAMSFLFDAHDFLSRHTIALRDTREKDGAFPPIAPQGGGFGGPLWQSAGIVLPWQIYLQYGDLEIVKDNYSAMKNYILMVLDKYIDKKDNHFKGTETWIDLGDWLGPQCNQNDKTLIFDSYLVYELSLMEKMSEALGYYEDTDFFSREKENRKRFINESYVNKEKGILEGKGFGPQDGSWTGALGGLPDGYEIKAHTSYAVPLALDVFVDENKKLMDFQFAKLVGNISLGDNGKEYPAFSLMTGFIGTPWILHSLEGGNNLSAAYSILQTKTYPSWFYPLTLGATSVWERLNSMTLEDGFGDNNSMNSFNHYAFGCVYDWLIQSCGGICPDSDAPGFKHFFLKPGPDPTGWLKNVSSYYESPYGRIESCWEVDSDGMITYKFTVPANTSATLTLQDETFELTSGKHEFKKELKKD